jgi:hypothetical protein
LTNTGTLAVESGRMVFAGADALTLNESSTLAFTLSGTDEAVDFGTLDVSHELVVNGELKVSLAAGYSPVLGDTFDILDWQTISGEFDDIVLPPLAADLAWNTSQLYVSGEITAGLAGDYNFDGTVDAADYVVWRKFDNSPAGYTNWVADFGRRIGGGGASPVPEPGAFVTVLLLAAGMLARQHGRNCGCRR